MRALIFYLIILSSLGAQAKSYYVSSSTGNDANAGILSAPWQSLNKVNTATFASGDSIFFRRGDVFQGKLIPNRDNLVFSAYGTGSLPEITGFVTVTGWALSGVGIYSSNPITSAPNRVSVVTVNGVLTGMGRFPNYTATNKGYLTYRSVGTLSAGDTSLTSNQLSTTNWTGAQISVRKERWILDTGRVKSQVGTKVSYRNPAPVTTDVWSGVTNTYPGKANYGFFFQDDIRTLDSFGEWYWNNSGKTLQVYFGNLNPASYTIKVSAQDTLVHCGGYGGRTARSNIKFSYLRFTGAGYAALIAKDASNITVSNCEFEYNFDAVKMWYVANALVESSTIKNCLNTGVRLQGRADRAVTVRFNTISKCGLIPGMGRSGDDGQGAAVFVDGLGVTITNNRIDSIGFNGIDWKGGNVLVDKNYITNTNSEKNDGGAIYTYTGLGKTNRTISNNIIITTVGAAAGTSTTTGDARGIYIDGASDVNITSNSVSSTNGEGIFLNNSKRVNIRSNMVYNTKAGISMNRLDSDTSQVRNNTVKKNIIYPVVLTQNNFFYWNGMLNTPTTITIQNDMRLIAVFDSNYYRDDVTNPFDYYYHLTSGGTFVDPASLKLTAWKPFIAGDAASVAIPTTSFSPFYNPTNASTVITLDGTYRDVYGNNYVGTITIPAYGSALLTKISTATVLARSSSNAGSPNPVKDVYRINFFSESDQFSNVNVIDAIGRIVYRNKIRLSKGSNIVVVNTSVISSGTYILSLSLTSGSKIYRFVKN